MCLLIPTIFARLIWKHKRMRHLINNYNDLETRKKYINEEKFSADYFLLRQEP